ncbi:MAG: hypothetical protein ACLGH7_08925 [Actinomycetes bacterium]
METSAVVKAEGRGALTCATPTFAALLDELDGVLSRPAAADAGEHSDADPLQELADSCLGGLGVVARMEAATAAAKVQLLATYAQTAEALEGPAHCV